MSSRRSRGAVVLMTSLMLGMSGFGCADEAADTSASPASEENQPSVNTAPPGDAAEEGEETAE